MFNALNPLLKESVEELDEGRLDELNFENFVSFYSNELRAIDLGESPRKFFSPRVLRSRCSAVSGCELNK